jgi:fused signal recognition particle receptor
VSWFGKNKKNKSVDDDNESEKAAAEDQGDKPETEAAADAPEPEPLPDVPESGRPEKSGYFRRLKKKLSKSRRNLSDGLDRIFFGDVQLNDLVLEDLEELLITSDIGVEASMDLIGRIAKGWEQDRKKLRTLLRNEVLALLTKNPPPPLPTQTRPRVVMVIGVNGVGKTTTIGKLAAQAGAGGQKVLVAAADTFRAAASEQLTVWADRSGAEIVMHKEGADPAAVAYDAVEAAMARQIDTVIVDTAGRLHTKVNLMEELKKIKRSIGKKLPGAPHEILLVLDATTGQNAISQAHLFNEALDVTGLVLAKLDGTAKGGIVVAICNDLKIPLQYIGVGEQINDLRRFDPQEFVEALF